MHRFWCGTAMIARGTQATGAGLRGAASSCHTDPVTDRMDDMASIAGFLASNAIRAFPSALAIRGPGQLGRAGTEGILIFDAGQDGSRADPILRFYAEDEAALDWLEDYLRDPDTTVMVHDLLDPEEPEEEPEEIFQKNIVLGTDAQSTLVGS